MEIDVFVNPSDPTKAVLERGVSWMSALAVAFGLAIALFAVLMLVKGAS
jgi:Protein of unknown function (DUF3592)